MHQRDTVPRLQRPVHVGLEGRAVLDETVGGVQPLGAPDVEHRDMRQRGVLGRLDGQEARVLLQMGPRLLPVRALQPLGQLLLENQRIVGGGHPVVEDGLAEQRVPPRTTRMQKGQLLQRHRRLRAAEDLGVP